MRRVKLWTAAVECMDNVREMICTKEYYWSEERVLSILLEQSCKYHLRRLAASSIVCGFQAPADDGGFFTKVPRSNL